MISAWAAVLQSTALGVAVVASGATETAWDELETESGGDAGLEQPSSDEVATTARVERASVEKRERRDQLALGTFDMAP
jgi:Tfp pilus assembly protein PilN